MTTIAPATPASRRLVRPKKREVAFLLFGAAFFTLAVSAVTTVCVVCAHPATVAFG